MPRQLIYKADGAGVGQLTLMMWLNLITSLIGYSKIADVLPIRSNVELIKLASRINAVTGLKDSHMRFLCELLPINYVANKLRVTAFSL